MSSRFTSWVALGLLVAGGLLLTRGSPVTGAGPPPNRAAANGPDKLDPASETSEMLALSRPSGPAAVAADWSLPGLVRVGLATDLTVLDLPCCRSGVIARIGQRVAKLSEPIEVAPAAGTTRVGVFRIQVAALKDEWQANGLADRLERMLEAEADTLFDAATDLYRVRVGSYPDRRAAEHAERELRRLGVTGSWLVHEGGGVVDPAFRVRRKDETRRIAGRELVIESSEGWVETGGRRLRGRLVVYLNDRGKLNLINELPLDDYLRGVVPREMGPAIYDQLEALKAQTVAARTYTIRNLGEFAEEGYDICATPRCQVYGGMGVEHPLSDRAVSDTAGEVLLFAGKPADALYSSTCGGHTENVEAVFPLKQAPYLRGVPCLEAGVAVLRGRVPAEPALTGWLLERLLPSPTAEPRDLTAHRLLALAVAVGLKPPADELRSLEAGELRRYIASLFDLVLDPRLLSSLDNLERLTTAPPPDWGELELELATALSELGSGSDVADRERIEALLYRLVWSLGLVEERSGAYLRHNREQILLRSAGQDLRLPLDASFVTYRRRSGGLEVGELSLLAGDPVRLVLHRGRVLAVIQGGERPSLKLDGTAHRPSWRRFRSEAEIRGAVSERYPGFEVRHLEILDRGVSGRVARLRMLDDRDQELILAGLEIRWTLGLPDTLFTSSRIERAGGTPGWLFEGRGWGHGVGMCQVGAFGMAMRGATYREILAHYYTGLTLAGSPTGPASRSEAGG